MKNLTVKLLALFLVVCQGLVISSCKEKDDPSVTTPVVSVEKAKYSLAKGCVTLTVKADAAPAADLAVPFRVSGTAVETTDYTLSAKAFVFKAGEQTASVTITRNEANIGDENLSLIINLENGNGYKLSASNFMEIDFFGKNGYMVHFTDAQGSVLDDNTFAIRVLDMNGKNHKVSAEEVFELEVDPELSTAVEGTHFTFPQGKNVTIAANKYEGTFTIKANKVEAGKNTVALRIKEKAGYAPGLNALLTVELKDIDSFEGTWVFDKFVEMDLFSMYGEDLEKAPTGTANDKFTLAGNNATGYEFTPSFTGSLKNYFGTQKGNVTLKGVERKLFQGGMSATYVKMAVYKFPNVNVKFSAAQTLNRTAEVGMRMIEVDGTPVLEMTIDDWEPVSTEFGGTTYEFMKDFEDNGVKGSQWMPLRAYFTRAK